jgi:hypothetical protein
MRLIAQGKGCNLQPVIADLPSKLALLREREFTYDFIAERDQHEKASMDSGCERCCRKNP